MLITRSSALLLIGWLLLPQTIFAEVIDTGPLSSEHKAFDINHLQSLFESYKRGQAYHYARQYQAKMEGDPYFDYFFGVSAIDSGHASEGVFALERVLLTFPNDQVARLELARGYFVLQEYVLSRESFEAVLSHAPPPKVRDTAQAYLDQIRISESRYRPTHSGFLELSMGVDDNVNAGVDENVQLPFIIAIDVESLGQEDNFAALTGAWTYIHPMSPGWLFESTLSGDFHQNQELSQFDTATGTLQMGVTHLQASSKYKTQLIAQQFNLDGEDYRSLTGINFDWQYTLSEQSSLNSTLQYAQLDYPDLPGNNSELITLGLNYVHAFSVLLQPVVFTTISLGTEKAEDDTDPTALADTERDIYSIRAGIILSFTNTLALQTAIGQQNSEYAGAPFLQPDTIREDDYSTVDIGLLWAFARKWRLDTRLSYTENDSTFDLRDYERNVIDITVNYTF